MADKDDILYNFTIYDQVGYEIHKHFLGIFNKTQEISLMGLQNHYSLATIMFV